ncbi:MAG: AGE family epimerase/isomerase [Nocardioides sp.]
MAAGAADWPGPGFGWLDDAGRVDAAQGSQLWINCRMTHVFALELLRLSPDAEATTDRLPRSPDPEAVPVEARLAEYGVRALLDELRDPDFGGWFTALDVTGRPTDDDKHGYGHAFVVLAGASAAAAGVDGGSELLAAALACFDERFWSESDGLIVDRWDRRWIELEPYRGANANMHAVEALLAAYDVTGDQRRLTQARRVTERMLDFAAETGYLLCEHYDSSWQPLPDHHTADRAHRFRPYGATVGHLFEWSRLALHLRQASGSETAAGGTSGDGAGLLAHAEALFEVGVRYGWAADGAEGFVYTTGFDGAPIVRQRLHWVIAEAVAAAWVLWSVTGRAAYLDWHRRWWAYAERYLVDGGSWRHELGPDNRPAAQVWNGRPDTYHAYQATILPLLRPAGSFAGALRFGS